MMDDRTKRIAETIKRYRKLKAMSQEDLSQSSGINVSTIKKYETGYRNPKYEQLEKIAVALGININSFYGYELKTTGEFLSLIAAIEESTGMDIKVGSDKKGNPDPDTVSISFNNKNINDILVKYLELKEKDDASEELSTLLLSDTSIL